MVKAGRVEGTSALCSCQGVQVWELEPFLAYQEQSLGNWKYQIVKIVKTYTHRASEKVKNGRTKTKAMIKKRCMCLKGKPAKTVPASSVPS